MPATVIDQRFEIESSIGAADASKHFIARDLESGEMAFVKVIRPRSADSNESLQRQMQEYQLLRKLDHPNAVKVIKAGLTAENSFYIAMEFVPGERLSKLVDSRGRIEPAVLANYLDQLAGVLDLAHGYGIVHRDVSLRNILVQRSETGEESCKLVGFASAKVLSGQVGVTQTGVAIGSPDTMSPEQAMGRKVTKLSDIYSLGAVLFTALTGRLPFVGKNEMLTMVAHVKQPPPSFSEIDPRLQIPEAIEAVVQQSLCKEPAYRPKSAGELARMFRQAVENPDQMPEGLEELRSSSARSVRTPPPTAAPSAAAGMKTAVSVLLVVAALAVGALVGYVLSQ